MLYIYCYVHTRSIENIQAGIGIQVGIMLSDVTVFITGIVWAFTINWKLALVVLTLFPVLTFLSGVNIVVSIRIHLL